MEYLDGVHLVLDEARPQRKFAKTTAKITSNGATTDSAAWHSVKRLVFQRLKCVDEQLLAISNMLYPVGGIAEDEWQKSVNLKIRIQINSLKYHKSQQTN